MPKTMNPSKPGQNQQQPNRQQQQQQNDQKQQQNQQRPQQNQSQEKPPRQQQNIPKNPADPSRGRPQHLDKSGRDGAFKTRGPEDESRGKEGGLSPGAQDMQRDKFSGERMPRDTE